MTPSQKQQLAGDIRAAALLQGTFTLRSGQTSDQYFDKYLFESNPALLSEIGRAMVELVPQSVEVIAGLEMGGIPVVTILSQITNLPCAFIRKQAKAYGTCRYAEGAGLAGKRVLLIEDVVSTGGAVLDALEKLRGDGIRPIGVLCVIDRETGGKEALVKVGVPLVSVFTMTQILAA